MSVNYLVLGKITRPHGVRGELRMRIMTDYPERVKKLSKVYIGLSPEAQDLTMYDLKSARIHQDYVLLTLKGIDDRDQAERMRDLLVMVDIREAVPLEDDEVYLYQLIGMRVVVEDGTLLGTMTDIIETGANDVYVIDSPEHGEVLIPAIPEAILKTDTDTNTMTVRLMDGLIP